MSDKIGWQTITCDPETVDKYGRTAAVCSLGGVDLNGWMVTQGHAPAYRTYSVAWKGHPFDACFLARPV
jgi:endonuclease YncB( thermonuclease family)